MKVIFSLCFLVFLIQLSVEARLGDTIDISRERYGMPIVSPADKMNPLMGNAQNESYSYKGWRIRVAYINNHAVRMFYVRESKPDVSPMLQDYEIEAILEAEIHGGSWIKLRKKSLLEEAIFRTNHPNKLFVFARSSWKNTNGCIAYSPGGMTLYVDSPDATKWEITMANAKAEKRKQDTPDF